MIGDLYRATVRLLRSAGLVSVLLAVVAVWSVLATAVPQGDSAKPEVAIWAASHATLEPSVAWLGLHSAFTALFFLVCIGVLVLSTVVCSWQRTKVARSKTRALREARAVDAAWSTRAHSVQIVCDPVLDDSEILARTSDALSYLGIRMRRDGNRLRAVSSSVGVWGSPLFHWSLVALLAVIVAGNMLRADGMMALTVGETKADAPASYGVLTTGPWHDWAGIRRSFRLDAFEPELRIDGIDLGPTPTVTVLDSSRSAIKTQRVYPNMMLHVGSLSISAPAYGLAATMSLVDTRGVEIGHSVRAIDFAQTEEGGTVPVETLGVSDAGGTPRLLVSVTVPLDGTPGHYAETIPRDPRARLLVFSPEGAQLLDVTVRPGEDVALPGGGTLRLLDIGWYSRLSIVDDWTTPLLYLVMVVGLVGLSGTLLFRQQFLIAGVVRDDDGTRLEMDVRLWRNTPTNRDEIESELARALGSDKKETMS